MINCQSPQHLLDNLIGRDISGLLEKLEETYKANPKYHRVINIELASIAKKYKLIKGNISSLIEVNEDDVNETFKKIESMVGPFKIPDLRNKATELAQKYKIPFPSSTRKDRKYLLLWFKDNWNDLVLHEGENFLANL